MSDNPSKPLIEVATGRRPADLVLKNARIVNVISHEIHPGDVALFQGRIAGIGAYQAAKTIDLKQRYLCPGFIDAHVHIESSMLAAPEYARVVAARGTTAVVADPHEFANVLGAAGIQYVLDTSEHAPIRVFVMLSSCVPASPLETAGATLDADSLRGYVSHPRVLGLAEMMNYPGVIHGDPQVLEKLAMCHDRVIDGHAPSLSGFELNAYAAAGILSDHECITADEAREKLRAGLSIMIREGSQTRNLKAVLPLVTPATADRFMFCTDDKDVRDLLDEGHIDFMIRTAIAQGMDPILAIRLATWNTARYFRIPRLGAIAPGYAADFAVLDDLKSCRVTQVYRGGELVAENGECIARQAVTSGISAKVASAVSADGVPASTSPGRNSIRMKKLSLDDLQIPWSPSEPTPRVEDPPGRRVRPLSPAKGHATGVPGSDGTAPRIHVIEVLDNRIDTERSIEPALVRDGHLVADPSRDLAKMIVVERHRGSGEIGRGFARGFKLRVGAIASSVAHDAHNLIAVGMDDRDILAALNRVADLHGGWVVVKDGQVLAEVALPIAGLVTEAPARTVATNLHTLTAAARSLGCPFAQPFMCLAFLSLSVIGKLKLTNKGLIDVEKFSTISLIF